MAIGRHWAIVSGGSGFFVSLVLILAITTASPGARCSPKSLVCIMSSDEWPKCGSPRPTEDTASVAFVLSVCHLRRQQVDRPNGKLARNSLASAHQAD